MSTTDPVRQLVYISKATVQLSPGELADLAARAAERNAGVGVGGALLHGRGLFLQAMEGDSAAVEATLSRIALDPRHSAVRVLIDHRVRRPAFPAWGMTGVCEWSDGAWTSEHHEAVERMASIATRVPPGTGAHTLLGSFTKQVRRMAA